MISQRNYLLERKLICNSFKKILYQQFGEKNGPSIYALFANRYKEMSCNREIYENRTLDGHIRKTILPGIALYKALLNWGISNEEALESLKSFYKQMYRQTATTYKALGKMPFFFQLLRIIAPFNMTVTYPKEGWTTNWIENSNERIAFNVTKCFFEDVLKFYNHEQLLRCFCQIDDDVYQGISPEIQWKRTSTIGRSGSKCDFCFIKK